MAGTEERFGCRVAGETGEEQRGAGAGGEGPRAEHEARERRGLFVVTVREGRVGARDGRRRVSWSVGCLRGESGRGALRCAGKHGRVRGMLDPLLPLFS